MRTGNLGHDAVKVKSQCSILAECVSYTSIISWFSSHLCHYVRQSLLASRLQYVTLQGWCKDYAYKVNTSQHLPNLSELEEGKKQANTLLHTPAWLIFAPPVARVMFLGPSTCYHCTQCSEELDIIHVWRGGNWFVFESIASKFCFSPSSSLFYILRCHLSWIH